MRVWLASAALVVTLGCAAPCVPGETTACTCSDGNPSARICRASGQFDPCACLAPLDAGLDGGLDAGADAGLDPACRNNRAPLIRSVLTTRAHLPIGGVAVEPPSFEDPEGLPLTLTSQLFEGLDGGPWGPASLLDGGRMRVTLPAAGEYRLEVRASDGCSDQVVQLQVTGVDGRRLPFEVTAGLCCDDAQRPWVGATNPPRLLRLEADGGFETLAFLARRPTSLSLSPDGGQLAVGQDSRVSFFPTGQPLPWVPGWTAPLSHESSLVVLGNAAAWSFGGYDAQSIDLDGGALAMLDSRIGFKQLSQGALTSDGRFVVVNGQGRYLDLLFVNGVQLLVLPSSSFSLQSCGGLWSSANHARFFSGCGEVLEVRDGGFTHAGTLPGPPALLVGLGEGPNGDLVAAFSPTMLSQDQRVLWIDGRTFSLTASASRDLDGVGLTRLLPEFVFVDAQGAANVLTVLDEPSSTWWEILK